MNAVVFYSNTGQSRSVAKYLARQLCYPIVDIEKIEGACYKNLVLVFPVHCQNIPDVVKTFLQTAKIEHLTAVATYGKMCYGNVLQEIQHRYHQNIVAGAYIPTKHSYLENDDAFEDFERLTPLVEKIKRPSKIIIPKSYKNLFANLFPALRSRLGLRISKSTNCNNCDVCARHCAFKAITLGGTNGKCIRCLKCVKVCPNHALRFKLSLPLKIYLRKKKVEKLIIYV
jgi:ferredoxin